MIAVKIFELEMPEGSIPGLVEMENITLRARLRLFNDLVELMEYCDEHSVNDFELFSQAYAEEL